MKQLQFYKYATWVLLALNLSSIAFFILTRPHPPAGLPPPNGLKTKAVDVMNLDKQQHTAFLQSAERHMQKMKEINEQQKKLLKPYFQSIIDTTAAVNTEAILNEVQILERKKIEDTYLHFKEVKAILNKPQQESFETFMSDALDRILLETKKSPPPPKGF